MRTTNQHWNEKVKSQSHEIKSLNESIQDYQKKLKEANVRPTSYLSDEVLVECSSVKSSIRYSNENKRQRIEVSCHAS